MRRELTRYRARCIRRAHNPGHSGGAPVPPTPQDREEMRSPGYL